MADNMTLAEKLSKIDKLSNAVNAKAGTTIMGRLANNKELLDKLTIQYIPTPSANINKTIGGGFPRRRMTIVTGKPDSGKTSLLLETISLAMKNDPNFIACWLESESSLEISYVINTFHIDPERFIYIEHERVDAGEGALEKIEAILAANVCDMVVINSLKCLVPKEEMDKSISQQTIALQARMNAKMTRRFTSLIAASNAAFVVVQHLTTDIGNTFGRDPFVLSGGEAIRFASALTIDLRKRSVSESDPISSDQGIKIAVSVKKNHCTPAVNPYLKTEYYAIFGEGIEQYLETIQNAIEQGILNKAAATIKEIDADTGEVKQWNGHDLVWRGKEACRTFLNENPDYFKYLQDRVNGKAIEMSESEIEIAKQEETILENKVKKVRGKKKKADEPTEPINDANIESEITDTIINNSSDKSLDITE